MNVLELKKLNSVVSECHSFTVCSFTVFAFLKISECFICRDANFLINEVRPQRLLMELKRTPHFLLKEEMDG